MIINGPEISYSLWLEPQGAIRDQLRNVISSISSQTGSPVFEPHVTLLGYTALPLAEVRKKVEVLTTSHKSLEISLIKIQTGEKYFKSLFIECEASTDLFELNKQTKKMFSVNQTYHPHLSVMYAEISDEMKKKLIKDSLSHFPIPQYFKANSISIWKTGGPVDTWKKECELLFRLF